MVHAHIDIPQPGVIVDPSFEEDVRKQVCEMMGWRNTNVFPGSQPVSLTRDHLDALEKEDYWVCEKSDGTRYFLFALTLPQGPAVFLIDRKFSVRYVPNITLPCPSPPGITHHETLLDGELVADFVDGEVQLKFLVFDLMFCNSARLIDRPFTKRLGYCERDVIGPYTAYLTKYPKLAALQPFKIEMKRMSRGYGIAEVFTDIIPNLKHGNDGLIFTPVDVPYIPGTCEKLLKWKPAWLNSVDFVIQVGNTGLPNAPFLVFELYIGNRRELNFIDFLTPELSLYQEWSKISPSGRIVECRYDPLWTSYVPPNYEPPEMYSILPEDVAEKASSTSQFGIHTSTDSTPGPCPPGFNQRRGGWRFLRFRDDKHTPNDVSVMEKIFISIRDDVTPDDLLNRMPAVRANWKNREKELAASIKK